MKHIIILCLLFVCSCQTPEEEARSEKYYLDNIKYYRDTRTDICYAGKHLGSTAPVLTAVPCTDKVKAVALEFTAQEPVVR